jgi:phosphoadenosine phosphosulfate reductase
MPLVKSGQIVKDRFAIIPDGEPLPDDIAVLVEAPRFLADACEISRRTAPTGVVWPNDRPVAELAPYLGSLALVVLVFPSFRDGRAYSQARQLRERYDFHGEIRATGQVLRDQFLFMLRAGFDAFDVAKEADVAAFTEALAFFRVIYQPAADGRVPALRLRTAAPRANRPPAGDVKALNARLADAGPAEIVAEARRCVGRESLAVVSSFGTESAALLKVVADVDPSIPVLFIDTGWLFDKTLEYRDALVQRLGLRDVRTIAPDPVEIAARDPNARLWLSDGVACCRLRKVVPLTRALARFDAWISGRKRYQGGERAQIPVVEASGRILKFNPMARVTREEVDGMFARSGLPAHPLVAEGYASVGCIPCTGRTLPSDASRSGRWCGLGRTECGIHAMRVE